MNNILDNGLVRKYFYPGLYESFNPAIVTKEMVEDRMARDILRAMTYPIQKGETYIFSNGNGEWFEKKSDGTIPYQQCFMLRLPGQFQSQNDAVEEKIKFLSERYGDANMTPIETYLRELVKLAQEKK